MMSDRQEIINTLQSWIDEAPDVDAPDLLEFMKLISESEALTQDLKECREQLDDAELENTALSRLVKSLDEKLAELDEQLYYRPPTEPFPGDGVTRKQRAKELQEQLAARDAEVEILRLAVMVGVVQLFETDRNDVLKAFTIPELEKIVEETNKLRPRQVEDIYRQALNGGK